MDCRLTLKEKSWSHGVAAFKEGDSYHNEGNVIYSWKLLIYQFIEVNCFYKVSTKKIY